MMDQKILENYVNRIINTSMKLDTRQQILLLITLAYRYSYFFSEAIAAGKVEHGEEFLTECFIKPCTLVVGYLKSNRKIARKIAKELKGKEDVLALFMNRYEDTMAIMPMLSVICLFMAIVLIHGQPLLRGDWQMVILFPTSDWNFCLENQTDKETRELINLCAGNEIAVLRDTVDFVKKKCPAQNHNSLPLTDEFISELLDYASSDIEKVFNSKPGEFWEPKGAEILELSGED